MKSQTALVFILVACCPNLFAQSAEQTQKQLNREAEIVRPWGTDKIFVAAVKAQNAKKITLAEIERIDKEWMAGKAEATVHELITGPCSDHLRQLVAAHEGVSESFVMDNQGALVCATEKTSDYWQGDEAKWQRSFNGGKGALFIDRPKFDESSHERLAQISFPVLDGSTVVGAITVGIDLAKLPK